MKKLLPFLFLVIMIIGCKDDRTATSVDTATTDDPVTTRIALANGYANFEDVEQLNFTFNVRVNDTVRSQRAWKWWPQEDRVELTEDGEIYSYINDGEFDEEEESIDKKFINDTYWLLFPYQLIWSDYEFEHSLQATAPISGETMEKVTISFSNDGGYTPGDTYHLFMDEGDSLIREWTYESSGGRTLSTTWEDYETFKGITLAKMHRSPDNNFQLFFTDIEVIQN